MPKMHRILIAHGFKAAPDRPLWLAWLKEELEKQGHEVFAPPFPAPDQPKLQEWIQTIEDTLGSDFHNVIFIGHSLGGVATLHAIAAHKGKGKNDPQRARAVFLVAAPVNREKRPKETIDFITPFYDENGNIPTKLRSPNLKPAAELWKRARQGAEIFYHMYSEDDPLVALDEGLMMRRQLGGKFVPMKRMRHFDHQETFPKIKYLLDQLLL